MTKEGIYTAQASENDLGNKRHLLFPLFYAGQNVITQFKLAEEKRKEKRT